MVSDSGKRSCLMAAFGYSLAFSNLAFTAELFGVSGSSLNQQAEAIERHFERGSGGTFASFDGKRVGYWSIPGEGRPLLINVGLGESYEIYRETIWDLRVLGRPIFILELRGQGNGDRLSPASRQIYHVDAFDDYARDLAYFMDKFVQSEYPVDFIAHSTGSYAAIKFAAEQPKRVRKIILVSPLVEPELGSFPIWLARAIAEGLCLIGRCQHYIPFRRDRTVADIKFEGNLLTHSQVRFQRLLELLGENPELLSGGPSNRWLLEAFRASHSLLKLADDLDHETLQFSSNDDGYSTVESQKMLCERMTSCAYVQIEGSRHAMFLEKDQIRGRMMARIIQELKANK